jgi:hypothetical protein
VRRQDVGVLDFADEDVLYADFYDDPLVIPPAGGHGPVTWSAGTLLQIRVYLALGADVTAAPTSWLWTDITDYVRYSPGITATTGRADESSTVGPGSGSLTFDNRDGRFSRRNPNSPYYGQLSRSTPILVTVDPGSGAYPLLRQYVNEWPARFDKSLTDFTVPIRTGGILRRLSQGEALSQASIEHSISGDSRLLQYWPGTDSSGSEHLAATTYTPYPMNFVGDVRPGVGTDFTPPLCVLGSTYGTYVIGGIPLPSTTAYTAWTAGGLHRFQAGGLPVGVADTPDSCLLVVQSQPAGTVQKWGLYWKPSDQTLYFQGWAPSGSVLNVAGPVITSSMMSGCTLLFWMSVKQNGTGVDYRFGVERTTSTGTAASSTSGTLAVQSVSSPNLLWSRNGAATLDCTVGHIWVLNDALGATETTPAYGSVNGWAGEVAQERIRRLCSEASIPLAMQYGTVASGAMGAQPEGTFLDLLRQCEAVDGGVLYEDGWGLGYQSLAARYNAPASLVLDFDNGDVADDAEPTDDDQGLRNKWVITKSGGSSGSYTDDDSVTADGLYLGSATLYLSDDDQCEQVAAWRVHVGINPDHRWPSLTLRFDNTAGSRLIESWTGRPFGARMTIAHPPTQVSPDGEPIDVIIEGVSERVDPSTWTVKLNSSPARPYKVLEVEDLVLGRLDTDGCTLDAAATSSATSLAVTTAGTNPPWTPNSGDWPFDIEVAGERMTVTAVTGSTASQTLTVTRSVNGVVKAQLAGASLTGWNFGVLAL